MRVYLGWPSLGCVQNRHKLEFCFLDNIHRVPYDLMILTENFFLRLLTQPITNYQDDDMT